MPDEEVKVESTESTELSESSDSWSIDNPLPVQVVVPSDSSESVEDPEVEVHILGEETEADPVILQEVNVYSAKSVNRSDPGFRNLWKLEISGQEYNVLFPSNANLEVVNGYLYNMGSSSVTGLVIDSSFSDSSYSDYTITVLPISSSSTQTTVYRYGSRIYLTHYSTSGSVGLTSSVSYIQPEVISRPVGFQFQKSEIVIVALLALSCLISIVGGLFRR